MFRILDGDFDDPRVVELLRMHLTRSRAETAPGSAHALDIGGLQNSSVRFFTIWEGDALLGIGGLKQLSSDRGEVKSMRSVESVQRRGVGSAMLITSSRRPVRSA